MRKILNIILAACLSCCALTSCGGSSNEKDNKVNENVSSITIKISDEILEADPNSTTIQIANTIVSLPITLEELVALGATTDLNINSYILKQSTSKFIDVKIDGMTNRILFKNTTDSDIVIKDAVLYYIFEPLDFIYPKGIKIGTSIDNVIKEYGEPSMIDLDKYYYSFDSCSYIFQINLDTKSIINIEYTAKRQTE